MHKTQFDDDKNSCIVIQTGLSLAFALSFFLSIWMIAVVSWKMKF